MSSNLFNVSTRMNHAALDLVVISNNKMNITVRSNTKSYRKVDDLNRGVWTFCPNTSAKIVNFSVFGIWHQQKYTGGDEYPFLSFVDCFVPVVVRTLMNNDTQCFQGKHGTL